MPTPCLFITIHLVKIPFTTFRGDNKITTKSILGFSKVEKTLNTFSEHTYDASKTQKIPILQNSFKFALTLVLETFKLPRFYTQLGSILVGENMEIQHVLILDVVEDLRSFMLQKFSQLVFVQNTLRGCTIIIIHRL